MKQKYYVNNKQVDYTLFSAYLKQAIRHIIYNESGVLGNKLYKETCDLYYDLYNDMKVNGVIYTIDKIDFKVVA